MEKLKILEYALQNHFDCLRHRKGEFLLGDARAPMPMFIAATLDDLMEKLEEWLKETGHWFVEEK